MTAKMTVLEMVQDILSDMESDEVSSITDTVEAGQIEKVLHQVYNQMCANQLIPEHEQLIQLTTVVLADHPGAKNYLVMPDTVQELEWVKYNKRKVDDTDDAFGDVRYICPKDFMDLVGKNLSSDTLCTQVTDPTSSVTYYVHNDLPPEWWTSFDDKYIAFSSWDTGIDVTQILGTKSLAFASIVPSWTTDDDFTPAIDDNLFPYLVAEAKSTCFVNQKQTANPKIEKQARNQVIAIQRRKFRTQASEEGSINSTQGPNYGRRTIR